MKYVSSYYRSGWVSPATHRAKVAALKAEAARMREALRIIAGEKQCLDNLMSNVDVARAALRGVR